MKSILRKSYLSTSKKLKKNFILDSSSLIQNALMKEISSLNLKNVLIYSPYKFEISLDIVVKELKKKSIGLYLPKIFPNKKMAFNDFNETHDLLPNKYGILESDSDYYLHIDQFDLLIIPFLSVDRDGFRLGYGGGYFDRALEKILKKPAIIGIGYEYQIYTESFSEPHDIKYDCVITEERIHRF